jgi:hypothetical protein
MGSEDVTYRHTESEWREESPLDSECGCMGDFDLHIDRKGNLRIIQDGVLLYTLAPKPKEAP